VLHSHWKAFQGAASLQQDLDVHIKCVISLPFTVPYSIFDIVYIVFFLATWMFILFLFNKIFSLNHLLRKKKEYHWLFFKTPLLTFFSRMREWWGKMGHPPNSAHAKFQKMQNFCFHYKTRHTKPSLFLMIAKIFLRFIKISGWPILPLGSGDPFHPILPLYFLDSLDHGISCTTIYLGRIRDNSVTLLGFLYS